MKFLRLNLMILMVTLVTTPLLAEDEKPEKAEAPVEDGGFARFFNSELYGKALLSNDAATLADVALTLAEGERVLLRTQNGVTADVAFQAAIEAAKLNKDQKTLSRIEKFAKETDNTKVKQLLTLGAPSRGNILYKVILFNSIHDGSKGYSINVFVKLQYQQNGVWKTYPSYGQGVWQTIPYGQNAEFPSYRANDRLQVQWDFEGSSADYWVKTNFATTNPSNNHTFVLCNSNITRRKTAFCLRRGTPSTVPRDN